MSWIRCVCWGAAVSWAILFTPAALHGQGSQPIPGIDYYSAFNSYYQADYRDAYRDFSSGANTSIRFGTDRFLDWVCYATMAAECQFHLGNWPQAVSGYEQALTLYSEFQARDWQLRVQPPALINNRNGAVQAAQINWGVPQRNLQVAALPDGLTMMFGELNIEQRLIQGGAVIPAELKAVDVGEIMRCNAIALHRRRWIKGVACKFDPFTNQLHSRLTRGAVADGSLLGAWNGVLVGISHASLEEFDQAQRLLTASLQFGAGYDHPLTPIALLELALINYQQGKLGQATQFALEASYCAAVFKQYDVLEESLSLATAIHLANDKSPYSVLEPAIAWASRNRARLAQVSLSIRLAECLSESGQASASARVLTDALRLAGRTQLSSSPLVGRGLFVSAVNYFLEGRSELGFAELQKSLSLFAPGSRWLYQLGLTDSLFVSGGIGERTAELLYQSLLRDPTADDWLSDPVEAMAFLSSSHLDPIARWFEIVLARRDYDKAIEIAELLRRHRFFAAFPCGGRELAFRWVMHAPPEALDSVAEQQRQRFFGRFPDYRQLTNRAEQLRIQLSALPLNPPVDSEERKQQVAGFVELMDVAKRQDAFLASLALRREPAQMAFPPQVSVSEVRSMMRDDQLVLYGVQTAKASYLIGMTARGSRLISWHRTSEMQTLIQQGLKLCGLAERQIEVADLSNENWKQIGWELGQKWFPEIDWAGFGELPELIVIPDGPMWYFPFELLSVGPAADSSKLLLERGVVRYSPTLGTAIAPQRPEKRLSRTGVFAGPIDGGWDMERSRPYLERLEQRSPDVARFEGRSEIPSNLLATVMDSALVLTAVERPNQGGPFALFPLQLDRTRPDSQLGAWMTLPWEGIDHVVLPCFNANAAGGLRPDHDGNEIFFTACGLLASGCRTVVLSRWSTSGKSLFDLTASYLDKRDSLPAASAWRAAVIEFRGLPLQLDQENRVRPQRDPPETTATHPLFWSGYLVIDVPAIPASGSAAAATANVPANAMSQAAPTVHSPGHASHVAKSAGTAANTAANDPDSDKETKPASGDPPTPPPVRDSGDGESGEGDGG